MKVGEKVFLLSDVDEAARVKAANEAKDDSGTKGAPAEYRVREWVVAAVAGEGDAVELVLERSREGSPTARDGTATALLSTVRHVGDVVPVGGKPAPKIATKAARPKAPPLKTSKGA